VTAADVEAAESPPLLPTNHNTNETTRKNPSTTRHLLTRADAREKQRRECLLGAGAEEEASSIACRARARRLIFNMWLAKTSEGDA
jgi:hypothetical protein